MWNERYAEGGFAYGTEPNDFLREQWRAIPAGGDVLCLAEGEGRNAVFLAEHGYQVTAVDGSSVGLEKATRLARERGVALHCVVSDLADYTMPEGAFDGIVSIWCHVPPDLRAELHRDVVAGLKPGGVFVLEAYTPAQLSYATGGPPVAALMMQLDTLKRELGTLDFVVGAEREREVHEGKYHNGLSHVVQVVAKKPA